jgi:hypothetical protein
MSTFTAGVAGSIPLSDGRVVCAEQGQFELDVQTPHDWDLYQRGVIVPLEGETVVEPTSQTEDSEPEAKAPVEPAPVAQAPTPPSPPAGATTSAGSGEKAGA